MIGPKPRWRLAAAAFLLLLSGSTSRSADPAETPVSEWPRGPVRYLLSRSEEKEFRALPDDASRALFIRNFWRRRDPNPASKENEARLAYWQRVTEANSQFRESGRPGWLTDRGRIHILLGPPNDIQQDLNYKVPGQDAYSQQRGLLRWIYHGRVATGRHAPTFVVAFTMDNSGEWRVSDDAHISSVAFNPLSLSDEQGHPLNTRIQSAMADLYTDLGAAMDLVEMTTPPGDETALIETVSSDAFYGSLPIAARWDFYPGSGDGRTLAVVTAFVTPAEFGPGPSGTPAKFLLVGRVESESGAKLDLHEGSFTPAEEDSGADPRSVLLFQARALLPAGHYRAYIGIFETSTYTAGSRREAIDVPGFDPAESAITAITPARRIEPVSRPADAGYTLPFILGEMKVIPRERPSFPRSQGLSFYFQIAFARDRKPERLELRFYRKEGDELRPAGQPVIVKDPEPGQGWSFPLQEWPPGDFRLVVAVSGPGDSPQASQSFDFDVTDD